MLTMWKTPIVATMVAVAGSIGLATSWVAYSKTVNKPSALTVQHGGDAGGKPDGQESVDPQADHDTALVVCCGDVPVEGSRERTDRLKDRSLYYSFPTTQELIELANQGDEWAMREIAWPEGHPFHEKGRPFFKNNGPHPDGLFPYAGY